MKTPQNAMLINFEPDTTSRRTYDLESGNKVHVERKNPYGLLHIYLDRGEVPSALSGIYTNYTEAERAINKWLQIANKKITNTTYSHEEIAEK